MNLNDWYVNEVLRTIEQARRESSHRRQRWLREWRMAAPPRRAFAGWLGPRLVKAGQRLRRWFGADPLPMRAQRALQAFRLGLKQ